MKTYVLKVGSEIINKVDCETKFDATNYFASVKNLTIDQLLELYKVEEKYAKNKS